MATLWQIGQVDQSSSGFGLSPNRYRTYKNDSAYVVGASPTDAWNFILPGPEDRWAGGRPHAASIYFGLKGQKAACRLVCDFFETHYDAPPLLTLWLNGVKVGTWQAPAGISDAAIDGQPEKGRHSQWVAEIPARNLAIGVNELQIRSERGSWAAFDALRLEGPDTLQTSIVPPHLRVRAAGQPQSVLRTPEGPRQPINLEVANIGSAGDLVIDGDIRWSGRIEPGTQTISVLIPQVKAPRQIALKLTFGDQVLHQTIAVKPVRPWTVHLLSHSHVDIGYTGLQPEVAAMHRRNFFDALAVDRETASFPADARLRFNVEATWTLDNLLRDGTPAEISQVVNALKSGKFDCSASYCNGLTAVMRPEELIRTNAFSLALKKRLGISLPTASQTDIPGATWGVVAALHQAGVRNLVLMPNGSDRIGGVLAAWQDKPFFWESPSGKERILVWETASYGVAHGLRHFNGDRTKLFRTADPNQNFLDGYIFRRLDELNAQGYPYDDIAFPWSGTDNYPVDADVPYAVRHWNETYVVPKVVCATFTEACDTLVKKYGKKIPVVRGDFTPYWEDGVGSSAHETALNRASADRLVQAETLSAMTSPRRYDAKNFWEAWRNVFLYSEHTWGAWNSVSVPDADFVKRQWAIKQNFALEADRRSRALLASVMGNQSNAVRVANTTSWERTDLILIPAANSIAGDRVVDAAGMPVPSQRLSTGELAVLATRVPAFGFIELRVVPGKAWHGESVLAKGRTLESPLWRVEIDAKRGGVRSLRRMNHEYANPKAYSPNQYLYLPGVKLSDLREAKVRSIRVLEPGPLVACLRVELDAPGARSLVQDVRLVAGLDRVDFTNTLDKIATREKEGVHFAFPFSVPQGQVRIHAPWAVARPDLDQIAGSNKNWFNTQYFVDVSNAHEGVTWASLDAPLMEVGGITANLLGGVYDVKEWRQKVGPTQTLYSWALNNHWHTNYRAEQGGVLTFRYSVRAHGPYDAAEAYRFGAGLAQPLLITRQRPAEPLLAISDPRVVASALKPSEDGKALVVRLWCVGDKPARVRLRWRPGVVKSVYWSNAGEEPMKPASDRISLAGWEVATLRAELAHP